MTAVDNRTVTVKEAISRVTRALKKDRPVFIWGPPGVGKSELCQYIVDSGDLGKSKLIDIRAALLDPTDVRGFPAPDLANNRMVWLPPVDFPTEEEAAKYDNIVILFDELNSAAQSVQAALYQLILNKRVGQYILPKNVKLVAAGNRESDKGVTYRMPTPLANRFVHIEVRSDFDAWLDWAVTNKIHEDVVGYISFAKADLFNFDPRSSGHAFATPRSWTFVSQFCEDADISDAELTDLVAGTVGEGVAVKFMTHRKYAKDLPLPGDILEGKVKDCKVKEISAQYALTIGMCYELQSTFEEFGKTDADKWHKLADNFFRFMMDFFPTEMTVMGCRVAINQYNLPFQPDKLKHFDEFYNRFGKYVAASNED